MTSEDVSNYSNWLVVSKIFYWPFHIWDVILPIDESYFSKWLKPPTRLSAKTIKTTSHSASDLHFTGFGAITRQQSIAAAAQREGRWTVDHLGLSCWGNTSGGIVFIHRYTHTHIYIYIYRWKVHKYSDVTFRNWDQKPANNWDLASNNRDWD